MKITKKNGKCIFPFLHKGKLYTKCVEGQKGKWCATEIDKKTKKFLKKTLYLNYLKNPNQ